MKAMKRARQDRTRRIFTWQFFTPSQRAVPGTPSQHFRAAPAHKDRTRINLPRTTPLFPSLDNILFLCSGRLAEHRPPALTPSPMPSFARLTPPHQGIHSRSEFVHPRPAVPATKHSYGAFTGQRGRATGPKLLTPSPATAHHGGFSNKQTPNGLAQAARPDGAPRLCACVRAAHRV